MLSIFQTIDKIIALTASVPTVAAQKAHLDMLREQLDILRDMTAKLEQENAKLRARLAEYEQRENFVDAGICLLKKKPGGGVYKFPFCLSCKIPLTPKLGYFNCPKCNQAFTALDIRSVIRDTLDSMSDS